MKKLKIYKEKGEFVIERVNQFDTSFKRFYLTEEGLIEGLDAFRPVLHEYNIVPSDDVRQIVTSYFRK